MENIAKLLREKNIRLISQHIFIYSILESKCHATILEIFKLAKKKLVDVFLGTVYSTLEIFRKNKIIGQVPLFNQSYFDINFFPIIFCQIYKKFLI